MSAAELLTQREIASNIIQAMFQESSRISINDALAAAEYAGVSPRTLRRAAYDFGVRPIHNGNRGAFWERLGL